MEVTLCSKSTLQSTDSWQEAAQNKRYDTQSASNRDFTLRESFFCENTKEEKEGDVIILWR